MAFLNVIRTQPALVFAALLPFAVLFFRGLADVTVFLTVGAFLWHSWKSVDWAWTRQGWFIASLTLWAYLLLIATPLSIEAKNSLGYSLIYLRWPVFAAAVGYWVFSQPDHRQVFYRSLVLALAFIMLDTFWQLQMGKDIFGIAKYSANRLTGPLRGPVVGAISLRLFYLALVGLMLGSALRNERMRVLAGCAWLALGLAFAFVTGERMTFLLFSATSLLVFFGINLEFPRQRPLIFASLLTAVAALIALGWLYPVVVSRTLVSLTAALSNFANNPYNEVFGASLDVWHHHFWTGTGIHNFAAACTQYVTVDVNEACQRHAHNLYLQWLAEAGVAGLALFAVFVGVLMKTLWQGMWDQSPLLKAAVVSVFFVIFWPISAAPSFFNNWFGAIDWLAIGWMLAMVRRPA